MSAPTEAQLLEEVRRAFEASAPDDDAMTTTELAEAFDVSLETMRRRMRTLVKSGRFEVVRVWRPTWDGRMVTVPALRLLSE